MIQSLIKQILSILIAVLFFFTCNKQQAEITIHVDASKVEQHVTPYLYGACIEDVNHEIYGGLYDQKIFGESFEELVPPATYNEFSIYEGVWNYKDDELSVFSHPGAKMVYNSVEISEGTVETQIKFDRFSGNNAGLLIYVSNPGKGADNFFGYEISLGRNGSKVVIGKHKNNFEPIQEVAVNVDSAKWNKLKVTMNKGKFDVYLNDSVIFGYDNVDEELKQGRIALRTWNAGTKFRNLELRKDGKITIPSFVSTPPLGISTQWDPIRKEGEGIFALDTRDAYNGNHSQTIELRSVNGCIGISNASLNRWGIAIENGQGFVGSLYLKANSLFRGNVTVALQSADGTKEYAKTTINGLTNKWKRYSFNLVSNAADEKARFAIYIEQSGKLWIDQVTLMKTPDKQFRGLPLRKDIGEMMVNQGLTFLRYGGTMINVEGYRFKKMIGDRVKRAPYTGHWYRYSTNGFGIEDFLQFCDATGFTASFAININETPEDVADMIEYLNGPITSVWGKKRVENGHPEPYNIKYIGIGNEEVLFEGDTPEVYDYYVERFNLLYDAIKSKDPNVSLISTAWWRPNSSSMERVFKALDGQADYWDYHPWADEMTSGRDVEAELRRMKNLFLQWNPNTTMKCAIFEENGNTHNLQRVLGHVTIQNAVRRMGDFVLTSCAANALQPYKQNDNGWDQGQVFFTPTKVWGMPPYYAQQMASRHHQPLLVNSSLSKYHPDLDVTATRSEEGKELALHIANIGDKKILVNLQFEEFKNIKSAKAITLSGDLIDVNTPEDPEKIIPVEEKLSYSKNSVYEIKPYSYTILLYSR